MADLERRVKALESLANHMRPLGPRRDDEELNKQREESLKEINRVANEIIKDAREEAAKIPVDYSQRQLSGGGPVTDDHREINPDTGMQKGYVVLSPEERAKGFVRPVRRSYRHSACGTTTTMSLDIAETYARCPGFYSGTFCVACRQHFPLDQFLWEGTHEQVGS